MVYMVTRYNKVHLLMYERRKKKFADNLLTSMSSKMSTSFLSRKEIKVFDEKTFQDFLHIMNFIGQNRTGQSKASICAYKT